MSTSRPYNGRQHPSRRLNTSCYAYIIAFEQASGTCLRSENCTSQLSSVFKYVFLIIQYVRWFICKWEAQQMFFIFCQPSKGWVSVIKQNQAVNLTHQQIFLDESFLSTRTDKPSKPCTAQKALWINNDIFWTDN